VGGKQDYRGAWHGLLELLEDGNLIIPTAQQGIGDDEVNDRVVQDQERRFTAVRRVHLEAVEAQDFCKEPQEEGFIIDEEYRRGQDRYPHGALMG